jgi:DNA ligase-1
MTTKTLPQLAIDVKSDFAGMRFPVWGFIKVDGVRGCHVTGKFTGRSLEDMKNTALAEKFSGPEYAGFDGELTIDGYLTNRALPADLRPEGNETLCSLTTGITNRAKIKKGEMALPTNVVWNLFDYLAPDLVDQPYEIRYAALKRAVRQNSGSAFPVAHVRVLDYTLIENAEQAQAFIDECLAEGYEGAVFRDPKAKHKHGRATAKLNDFWRFKPASVKDCIITGFEEAMENQNEATTNALGRTERSSHKENKVGKGMIGTFLATDVATGQPIRLGPGSATHEQRTHWFNNPTEICGWPAEYVSLDTGVKDAPRQARFLRRREKYDLAVEAA